MSKELLDNLLKEYIGTIIERQKIYNENGRNNVDIHAEDLANKLGVRVDRSSSTTVINHVAEQAKKTLLGKVAPWLLGSLGPLGLVGGYFLKSAFDEPAPPPQEPPAVVEPAEHDPGHVGVEVE